MALSKKNLTGILRKVKGGDQSAFSVLEKEYMPLMKSESAKILESLNKSTSGNGPVYNRDDLIQECRLVLLRCAETYDEERSGGKVTFGLYAKICIYNRMISILRKEKSDLKKQKKKDTTKQKLIPDDTDAEQLQSIMDISGLTEMEMMVTADILHGMKASESAALHGLTAREVTNARYRAKSKIRKAIEGRRIPGPDGG